MKIAITAHSDDNTAEIDSRFGRADYFVIYDQEKDTWETMSNTQNLEAAHGAGIQAGQNLIKTGAEVLITGHVGPKAFKVLDAGNVKMYSFGDMQGSVKEALAAYLGGKLLPIAANNTIEAKR